VCLTNYWEQKKLMAPGCEPSFVKRYERDTANLCLPTSRLTSESQ